MKPIALCAATLAIGLVGAIPHGVRAGTPATGPRALGPLAAQIGETGGVLSLRSPGSKMILLPATTFTMGSTENDVVNALAECHREPLGHSCEESLFSDELPQRRVSLSAFWMDRTEVTVAAYQRCVSLRRCRPVAFEQGARRFARPDFPVSLVTWYDAERYCAFRGARLPTEAEFERAARGSLGRAYPWGNLYNSHASNHGKLSWERSDATDGFAELAPVDSFEDGATPEGIQDLAGNVTEWVSDRYAQRYDENDVHDPTGPGPAAGSGRVVRGGGYNDPAPWLRGAARDAADPMTKRPFLGFRCARSARRTLKASVAAPARPIEQP